VGRLTTGRICLVRLVSLSGTYRGLTDLGDSLKLRDLNSSASVILSGNGAQAAQVGGRRMLSSRQRCLVVLRRMWCRVVQMTLGAVYSSLASRALGGSIRGGQCSSEVWEQNVCD
jgi:hypothetical protein